MRRLKGSHQGITPVHGAHAAHGAHASHAAAPHAEESMSHAATPHVTVEDTVSHAATPDTTAPMIKPQKKSGGWRVIFWIALAVFIVCALVLGVIAWSYWAPNHRYQDLAKNAGPTISDTKASTGSNDPVYLSDLSVDWDCLRSINPDVIGWVYMPGTRINYPICQTSDNQYYLDTDFNGNRDISTRSGTIFLDANNSQGFTDQNNFMYGHHMNDGSMFACISTQLTNNSDFNAHRDIFVLTPQKNYECTTFAIVLTTGTDNLVQFKFNNADDMAKYIADKEQRSVVTPSEGMPDPSSIQKLFTFSTCDYTQDNGRAVMYTYLSKQAAADQSHTGGLIDRSEINDLGNGQ